MADYIPFEIQAEIMKRLPIKSLIRFRSVSKPWKSIIDSSEFNVDYHVQHTQPQEHILVRHTPSYRYNVNEEFLSLVDEDTFPPHKFRLNDLISITTNHRIIGSSQGLICFCRFDGYRDESGTAVIWNPSIRKSVVIDVPNVFDIRYRTVVGFGVSDKTSDPKLVKISYASSSIYSVPWQVEVFTLSTRAWKRISTNLPRKSIALRYNKPVAIDGVMYWLGFVGSYNLVISFDLTSEVFTEICFPPHLQHWQKTLLIYNYKPTNSLAVVNHRIYDVWIMEHGFQKSFTKLFTIKPPNDLVFRSLLEFKKNGEAIMKTCHYYIRPDDIRTQVSNKLVAYEPFSEHTRDLKIYSDLDVSISVTSYTESLLLLDHPDSIFHL